MQILKALFENIVVPLLSFVFAMVCFVLLVVFAIVALIVTWMVLAKLVRLISNLLSRVHTRLQPLCPACRQSRLRCYDYLPFSDAKQYRYYGCKQCKAHFKRSRRRGDWVSLRPGAANRKECDPLFDRETSLMQYAPKEAPPDPLGSWFGSVQVALPGEAWPEWEGTPMLPLCQIRCEEVITLPPALADLAMICVFAACLEKEAAAPNEKRCVVRTYASLEGLVPLPYPEDATPIHSYPMAWMLTKHALPDRSGLQEELWMDWMAYQEYHSHRHTYTESKVGGYRTGSSRAKPLRPALSPNFVLQIKGQGLFPWLRDTGGALSFSYDTRTDGEIWTVDWEPPDPDVWFERHEKYREEIHLGCEVEGMRIYLANSTFRVGFDDLVMDYKGRCGQFHYITDLRGLVHITTADAALRFVRLHSSGLLRNGVCGTEVLTKAEYAAQPPWYHCGAFNPWGDGSLEARTELEPETFRNLGLEPALVEAIDEGFRIVRWTFTVRSPSKTREDSDNAPRGIYQRIVETVKTDGAYTFVVIEERIAANMDLLRPASGPGETNPDELLRPGT